MKRVLLAAPNSYVVRNWLAGGLADACVRDLGLRPILVSPFEAAEFTSPAGNVIENWTLDPRPPAWYQRLNTLRAHVYSQEVPAASTQMLKMAQSRGKYHYAARAIAALAPRFSRRRNRSRSLLQLVLPRFERARQLLERAQPELLITGTPGFYPIDLAVLAEAGRLSIPRLCVINSWDNMTTRGSMVIRPERLAVWNTQMRDTAIDLHQFPESRISVTGALQMVPYAHPPTPEELSRLFRRLGLPPGTRYLLYVSSQLFQEYEAEEVRLLAGALAASEYADLPLVVRLHPQSKRQAFRGTACVLDQAPAFSDRGSGGSSFGFEEVRHLGALLRQAEVVFSSTATTAILEAVLQDRPAVQLAWTGVERSSPPEQAAWVQWTMQYPHIQFFNRLGSTLFSHTPEDLEETIRAALEGSEWRQQRLQAVQRVVPQPLDAPPRRLARLIREMMDPN